MAATIPLPFWSRLSRYWVWCLYIALQLKAIATTFELVTQPLGTMSGGPIYFWQDTAFHISWAMALFVIVFGTRDIDASEQHPGMILAVAFESMVVKLFILAVGIWVRHPCSILRWIY